jgi:hypothetical protein
MTDEEYTRYCGIGTTYMRDTPWGVQIQLLNTAQDTPAKQAGLQDGDVIAAIIYRNGQRIPARFNDFMNRVPGMEGSEVTLEIMRGMALPEPEPYYGMRHYEDERADPYVFHTEPQSFTVTLERAYIVPGLSEEDFPLVDVYSLPFQSPQVELGCTAIAQNDTPSHGLPPQLTRVAEAATRHAG